MSGWKGGHYLFLLRAAFKALSIVHCALTMAAFMENDSPVLIRVSSRCTIHLKPVGLAV